MIASNRVAELNKGLSFVIQELHGYLMGIRPVNFNHTYADILSSKIYQDDIVLKELDAVAIDPSATMVLNFNYTSVMEYYVSNVAQRLDADIKVNYIHGQLNTLHNPLIFGFGDELDEAYQQFELHKTKGIFELSSRFGISGLRTIMIWCVLSNLVIFRFISSAIPVDFRTGQC